MLVKQITFPKADARNLIKKIIIF